MFCSVINFVVNPVNKMVIAASGYLCFLKCKRGVDVKERAVSGARN